VIKAFVYFFFQDTARKKLWKMERTTRKFYALFESDVMMMMVVVLDRNIRFGLQDGRKVAEDQQRVGRH